MRILSFDTRSNTRISRDPNQDGLFNLFQKNIINSNNVNLKGFVVPREYEMRLDKISNHIYGTPDYMEELMVLNDIISPYSVKEGQLIYFCSVNSLPNLYTKDEMLENKEAKRQRLITSSQPNRNKEKVTGNQNLPPTIKPSNLDQIKVSKDNKVQIINTFQ
jgi:hypothetical protein